MKHEEFEQHIATLRRHFTGAEERHPGAFNEILKALDLYDAQPGRVELAQGPTVKNLVALLTALSPVVEQTVAEKKASDDIVLEYAPVSESIHAMRHFFDEGSAMLIKREQLQADVGDIFAEAAESITAPAATLAPSRPAAPKAAPRRKAQECGR